MSSTPEVDRFLTRGPRGTPDSLARHHPQCYVKTKRETEGDEGGGGEQKRLKEEKQWRRVGDQRYPDRAVNRSCPGKPGDHGGPGNSCRSLTHTHSHARWVDLGPPATSRAIHEANSLRAIWLNFFHRAGQNRKLIPTGSICAVLLCFTVVELTPWTVQLLKEI